MKLKILKGRTVKRLLSVMLVLMMVFTLIPMSSVTAFAESATFYTVDFSYDGKIVVTC